MVYLINRQQAADLIGCDVQEVKRLLDRGQLKDYGATKEGRSRHVLWFSPEDVAAYLKSREQGLRLMPAVSAPTPAPAPAPTKPAAPPIVTSRKAAAAALATATATATMPELPVLAAVATLPLPELEARLLRVEQAQQQLQQLQRLQQLLVTSIHQVALWASAAVSAIHEKEPPDVP